MPSAVTDSIFTSGHILMPLEPTGNALEVAQQWSDSIVVSVLVIFSTVLAIINIRNFVLILPSLWDSFIRAKGNTLLENKITLVRARSITALCLMLPFCLIVDRHKLLPIDFLSTLLPNLALAATIGIFLAYVLLRAYLGWQLQPHDKRKEAWITSQKSTQTFFIIMAVLCLIATGIMALLKVEEGIIKVTLYYILGFIYLVSILRRIQILSTTCKTLTIILYLCALEIIPNGLIACAIKFL